MSSFTEARLVLVGETLLGRAVYQVRGAAGDGFWFYIGRPDSGLGIHCREGFRTDRASIPPRIRRLLKFLGLGWLLRWAEERLAKGAVIHDLAREDLQFALVESDALGLVAWHADGLRWSAGGPWWKRLARVLLRELAFAAVRTNRSRINHQLAR